MFKNRNVFHEFLEWDHLKFKESVINLKAI